MPAGQADERRETGYGAAISYAAAIAVSPDPDGGARVSQHVTLTKGFSIWDAIKLRRAGAWVIG